MKTGVSIIFKSKRLAELLYNGVKDKTNFHHSGLSPIGR